MADLLRMRVEWSGAPVIGGGVSTLYFSDGATGMTADVEDFFDAVRFTLPGGVAVRIPDGGDKIDVATGALSGTWGGGSGVSVVGAGLGSHAGGVGARVTWRTAGVNGGRRVVGSTFLVPLTIGSYDTDGTIVTGTVGVLQAAADALVAAQISAFSIWSRSQNGGAGAAHEVISARAPDKVSWLRSRRT